MPCGQPIFNPHSHWVARLGGTTGLSAVPWALALEGTSCALSLQHILRGEICRKSQVHLALRGLVRRLFQCERTLVFHYFTRLLQLQSLPSRERALKNQAHGMFPTKRSGGFDENAWMLGRPFCLSGLRVHEKQQARSDKQLQLKRRIA